MISRKIITRKYATLRRVGFREVFYKYSRHFFPKFQSNSVTKKIEDGLIIHYFRGSSFPTPDEFNRMGYETFDIALSLEGNVAIDIGAHVGAYALRLARKFRFVYAFEPNPVTFRILARNIKENHIENIEPLEIAVSDTPGKKRMRTSSKFLPASTLAEKHYDWVDLDAVMFPMTESLDHYFRNGIGKIDFIKIDAENHELSVLKGMRGIIEKHRPIMSVEVHQKPSTLTDCECNVCNYLRELGLSVELHGRYTPEMEAHWLIVR